MGRNGNKRSGIIYYTDNRLDEPLFSFVQEQLNKAQNKHLLKIYSASLKPIDFGENVVVEGERSYPTMVKQIIAALEMSSDDYIFFCEHDVLYDPSHFEFTPPKDDIFYYNINVWRWLVGTDKVIRHDRMMTLSCMAANREFTLDHYLRRQQMIEKLGWDKVRSREPRWARRIGYEPGTKKLKRGGFSDDDFGTWLSAEPNIDVRHKGTFSSPKIHLKDFTHAPNWWSELPIDKIYNFNLKDLI